MTCPDCDPDPCACRALLPYFEHQFISVGRLDADGNLIGDPFEFAGAIVEHAQDPANTVEPLTFGANVYVSMDLSIIDPEVVRVALGLPDPLDEEREALANERAERQTLAWKYGVDPTGTPLPRPADPTSILDEDDPWAP